MGQGIAMAFQFGDEILGLAFLEKGEKALLAVGKNQDALIDVVESSRKDFDEDSIDNCLVEIAGLPICAPGTTAYILTDSIARFFSDCITGVINNELVPKLAKGDLAPLDTSWVYFDDCSSLFLAAINDGSPKAAQVFSKQQLSIILDETMQAGVPIESQMRFESKFASRSIPDAAEIPPNMWEGSPAKFLVVILSLSGNLPIDYELSEHLPPGEYPWRHNALWN